MGLAAGGARPFRANDTQTAHAFVRELAIEEERREQASIRRRELFRRMWRAVRRTGMRDVSGG